LKLQFAHKNFQIYGGGNVTWTSRPDSGILQSEVTKIINKYQLLSIKGLVQNPEKLHTNSSPHHLDQLTSWDKYSDISILVEGKLLKAHRIVLYTRCIYFKKMFDSGMIECKEKQISIMDEKCSTFEALLYYLYTDDLPSTRKSDSFDYNIIADLLCLADVYNMDRLIHCCEAVLKDFVNNQNVNEFKLFAEEHQASRLANYCKYLATTNKSS